MQNNLFITGAAGGFGRATAHRFAAAGYFIGLYDVDEAGLAELAAELGPDRCCFRRLDVTDPTDCAAALAHFTEHTEGTLHVLLNNAGITAVGPFEEVELARSLRVVDVNLKGPMHLSYLAFPYLKRTPGARVINVASASAIHGNPELVAYSLTKRALNSFTESLDIAWEEHGIRVCDVNPMYARTRLVTDYQHLHRALPDKQVRLTAEDVAEAIFTAANGNRVHHYVGTDTKFFAAIRGLVPFRLRRAITKRVIGF